ncbi:ABC transporter permease [Pelagibius litoralis]|uniref:ABC transporter permease n=1 Tax=Pelagibius litoralis TaxID=374515 RepID=A0A967C9U2_9PROT|nr:ABC transporter permease [Pelagibius litoralis]NIA67198.1 ABC transporter permease [Pelagibius litoralis]
MLIFIARRIGTMVLTMLVVSLILFLLLEINVEGVAIKVLGAFTSDQQREIWLEENGYFDPLPLRYARWVGNAVVGDFGESVRFKVPVSEILLPRIWSTAVLGFWALLFASAIGLFLGVIAGMREGSKLDRTVSVGSIVTTSVPEFASAPLLSALFVFYLPQTIGWGLPGTSSMSSGFDWVQLILPVMVLVLYDFGYIARMTRASMAEVMMTHYIRTAVLKGLPYGTVIRKHALRNALIAPFTVIMLQINWLLSGVIVVEFFFAYKGFGSLLLEASLNQDIFLIEACAMVAVFVAVATQTLADIGYTYLNPRIRFS